MGTFVIPVIASILILGGLGFSQDAFAAGGTISDQASCVLIGGTWIPPDTCQITSLTVGGGQTLDISSGIIFEVTDTLTAQGTINNSGTINAVNIELIPLFSTPELNNSGIITSSGNFRGLFSNWSVDNTGTIIILSGGDFDMSNGIFSNTGILTLEPTISSSITLKNAGPVTISAPTTINSGVLVSFDLFSTLVVDFAGSIDNAGTLDLNGSNEININSGTIDNNGVILLGGLFGSSAVLHNAAGTINNFDTIRIFGGTISNEVDGTFVNTGTLDITSFTFSLFTNVGTFTGTGTIIGPGTFESFPSSTLGCGTGTTLDTTTNQCVPSSTLSCGTGTQLNAAGDQCVPSSTLSCGAGTELNPAGDQCVPSSTLSCGTGTQLNPAGDQCVPSSTLSCGTGTELNPAGDQCVPSSTLSCGTGTELNPAGDQCVAVGNPGSLNIIAQIEAEIDDVEALVDNDDLKKKDGKKITKKLEKAIKDTLKKTCKQMDQFIKEVNKLDDKGKIGQADADSLIQAAQAVKADVGCT